MAPRGWISGSMQLCPVLISVISCHHQVSYIDIKRWRKSQNITRSLWWVALHFLFFGSASMKVGELVSQRKWAMFPMKLFIIYNITKNQVAIVVVFFHKKSLSHHPHFTAERESWQETGKIRMKHMVAPFLHHVWDFYELFWIMERGVRRSARSTGGLAGLVCSTGNDV